MTIFCFPLLDTNAACKNLAAIEAVVVKALQSAS